MTAAFILSSQGGYVPDMVSLSIVFMAVLMSMAIASAALSYSYRDRFSMPGLEAGSSREAGNAPIDIVKRGGLPSSARAALEVRNATRERGVFRGRKAAMEGRVERVRHPLSPSVVSNVERWKLVVSFVATVGLGVVAYAFGEPPRGLEYLPILASLVVFFIGAVLLARGSKSFRRYHIARATPTTDASDVSPGEKVELYGRATVSDQGTHKAPFSDDDCLVCVYEILEKRGKDKVADSGTAGMLFYLDDGTGKVLVDPEAVELHMPLDTQVEVRSKRPPDEITRGYVNVGANKARSEYRESYLKPGENVYVYGDAVASDEHGVVIRRRDKDSVFLIADSSEGELRKSLLSRSVFYGAVGVALMSAGLGVVFTISGVSVI